MKRAEVSVTATEGKPLETVKLSGNPFASAADRSPLHQDGIDGYVYRMFLRDLKEQTGILEGTAIAYVGDILAAMTPRDAMERMLVTHAVWCHGRVMKLNLMLAGTAKVAEVKTLSELVDRASNDFRKSMLALAEYRKPRRRSAPKFIGQLNQANQQVVQNGGKRGQGGSSGSKRVQGPRKPIAALPPAEVHSGRPRGSARRGAAKQAVGTRNRTAKRRG